MADEATQIEETNGTEGNEAGDSSVDTAAQQEGEGLEIEQSPVPENVGAPAGAKGPEPVQVDVDAEFSAIDRLNADLEEGRIMPEEYNKQFVAHQKNITKAQKELLAPAKEVQKVISEQKRSEGYWSNWGKGDDIAQKLYGGKVPSSKAAQLLDRVRAQVAANPRYANRPEIDTESIVYDKWMDEMDTESKKPAPPKPPPAPTRATGSVTANQPMGAPKTAQQKLNDGEYGDLAGEMTKLAGW